MPDSTKIQKLRLACGIEVAFRAAGDRNRCALVLLHGFPSSSRTFREVIEPLSRSAFVVAPDLPGFGESDVLSSATFAGFADCIEELLSRLEVRERYIYLHDFGAPVGLQLAMRAPHLVCGLIVQNANAHHSGFGPQWADTLEFWSAPNSRNEKAATAHLTLEGTRDQYVAGVPMDIGAPIDPQNWMEDWRIMCQPGRMQTQRRLVADYAAYVARFDDIAGFLKTRQPPALMLWGRHDAFFDIAEIQSWLGDLPRMEAHILDGGHFLLETHAARAAALIAEFLQKPAGWHHSASNDNHNKGDDMSDDKSKPGGQDRTRISLSEAYEVRDWAKKFGVSEDELRKAVGVVGNDAAKVQAHLKGRK
jgi:pimeloyl-ACP methyl ester carboxylesterase